MAVRNSRVKDLTPYSTMNTPWPRLWKETPSYSAISYDKKIALGSSTLVVVVAPAQLVVVLRPLCTSLFQKQL